MATLTVEQFVETVEKSNLLSPTELARVRSEADEFGSDGKSIELARKLVEEKLLTRWQAEMLLAGRHAFFLGRYKLLERIGAGGMGSVFKAEQEPLGRLVAIKVMSRKLMKNQESVARFYREIQSAAALDHPNIVAAYDADHAGQTYFLVMEYVDGEDLATIIKKRGALPVGEACSYVMQAAMGLQHAFERSLVHRDIKPSNLLVSRQAGSGVPVVKVLDMGLARVMDLEVDGGLTQTGQIMGTPDYIAPEQARDSKAADIRSDIFGLGCTLYRLLTNRLPFGGTTLMEKLMARSSEDAPPVSRFRPEVPPSLEAVVARMIARQPEDRYQTPAEVVAALAPFATAQPQPLEAEEAAAADPSSTDDDGARAVAEEANAPADSGLQQFLHDLDSEASFVQSADSSTQTSGGATAPAAAAPFIPEPPATETPAWSAGGSGSSASRLAPHLRRRREPIKIAWRPILAAGGTLLLLVLAYLLWSWTGRTAVIVDWPAEERADATIVVDGRKVSLPKKGPLRFADGPGRRTLALTRKGYKKIEKEWSLGRGKEVTFRPNWKPTSATQRRQKLAALREEFEAIRLKQYDEAKVAKVREGLVEFHRRHPGSAEALEAAWLMWRLPWPVDHFRRQDVPESALALAGGGRPEAAPEQLVAVLGKAHLCHSVPDILAVAFSPNGELLATGGYDFRIRLWDVETGDLLREIPVRTNGVGAIAFSPDGTRLAGRNNNNTVGVWNVETGELICDFGQHTGNIFDVSFSPDGQTVASSDDYGTRLWDAESAEEHHFLAGQRWEVYFTSDGKRLVTVDGEKGAIRLWNTESGEPIEWGVKGNGYLTLGPENLLACRSEDTTSLLVWNLADDDAPQTTIPLTGWHSPRFSPDGKLLAVVLHGNIALFDVESGQQPADLPGMRAGGVIRTAFSPDGKTLAAGLNDGTVRLFDLETGKERLEPPGGHRSLIKSVAVSPDGRLLATGGVDGSVRVWDLSTGREIRVMKRRGPALLLDQPDQADTADQTRDAHKGNVNAVEFCRGGRVLASAGDDQVIRLWNVEDGELTKELQGHFAPVLTLAYDPTGERLASGGADNNVRLWNVSTGQMRKVYEGHTSYVNGIAFSPDGLTLASCSYNGHVDGIVLWNVETGKRIAALKDDANPRKEFFVTFNVDGTQLFCSAWGNSNNSIRVWDVKTRKIVREIPGTTEQTRVVCQPQGRFFARSVGNGELDVRDTRYFIEEQNARFQPDYCMVGDVAYTPDGRHLVAAQGNGTICVLRLIEWSPDLNEKEEDIFP